ncbi:hypothetical protein N9N28_17155 [Rubripirellula amarantea]|uniref:Uncharacterized protein n=1 Tax=Rubripirellula amarantea TaxID=2527999 RepID=A0A5C5WSP4_9BACT|nr:hypothetical protein [Rubripirellula amarantea]MDA8746353.1 hypothetical protein [Rubripirellula amarantea]TWT52822.1 hypothetical protein Pla22_04500 [Rubripirellula amarantea]
MKSSIRTIATRGSLSASVPTRRRHQRRGSALLLCTLATVVLSLSAIAILKSHSREIGHTEAMESSVRGRLVAGGLLQRTIAQLRVDPLYSGTVTDRAAGSPDAFAQVTRVSASATRIDVFLYAGSRIPATSKIVDPTTL